MKRKRLLVFLCFLAGTLLLYFPVLGNGFLTDDYASLHRVLIERRILYREFLRPLIDVSFYLNWLVFGLHPAGYYAFNFVVHALTCFMVYRVVLDLPFYPEGRRESGALVAGLLFLFYPFHNEGVVWLSGRLSSMAALFALLAMHFSLTKQGVKGFLAAVLCWFLGLFAYESIIVLPAMILMLEWVIHRDRRRMTWSVAAWGVAGLVCIVLRHIVAGAVVPNYGKGERTIWAFVQRMIKVLGRCFLPPMENSRLMIGLFSGLLLALVLGYLLFRRRRPDPEAGLRLGYIVPEALFLVALLPALAFGVSTRTSEGDRILYFPSCFLCILCSALLFYFVSGRVWRVLVCVMAATGGIILIGRNNRNWVFASRTATAVLDSVRAAPGRVLLVNAPDEWEGAYIFRNNFETGLEVNGVDARKVLVTHFLMRLEYLPVSGGIEPVGRGGVISVYPATRIISSGDEFRVEGIPGRFRAGEDRVYYWDKLQWKQLNLPRQQ